MSSSKTSSTCPSELPLPSWLEKASEDSQETKKIPYVKTRKFFAFVGSGSTSASVVRSEVHLVAELRTSKRDAFCVWDHSCEDPQPIQALRKDLKCPQGGTAPASIIKHPKALDCVKGADLWMLITDGEIYDGSVNELAMLAEQAQILQIPIVLVIVGRRSSPNTAENISVGISFFASALDALILYKSVQTEALFVIDAKGIFEKLKGREEADVTDSENLATFSDNKALMKAL